jgi:hypothetical protein
MRFSKLIHYRPGGPVWLGDWELVYLLELFSSAVFMDSPTFSGDAGIRAENCNWNFALRPDSSVVERGPEKAGVGGSIPSLATTP